MKEISVYADDSFTLKILPALKVAVGLGGVGWGGWGGEGRRVLNGIFRKNF